MLRKNTSFALVLASFALAACADPEPSSDVGFAANSTTVVQKKLEYPGNVQILGDKLIFSTAHFVASGDPELDQEFAYWEGALWSKPLKSGAKKQIGGGGAVMTMARIGDDLLVIDSGYNGVTRYAKNGKSSDFYNDYAQFPDDPEEGQTLGGVAVGKDYVYVTRSGSEVMRMGLDGSDVVKFAKTWKSGWVEYGQQIVATDKAIFWSTEKQGSSGSKYNLYRATPGGTVKKLATYDGAIRDLETDGTHVFIAIEKHGDTPGQIAVALSSKTTKPKTLVKNQARPDNLLFDAQLGLLFTEGETDVLAVVDLADVSSSSAVSARQIMSTPNATSLALSADHLYVSVDPSEDDIKGEIWRTPRTALVPQ